MSPTAHLRIIGDVHGKVDWNLSGKPCYFDVIRPCSFSLQVGDMGDAETYAELTARVDPARHRFIGGNHEQYPDLPPHHCGDFGSATLGGVAFFFVRGAFSVDKALRLRQQREKGWKLWYEEEELDEGAMKQALDEYARARPELMVTHTAPTHIAALLADADASAEYGLGASAMAGRTGELLERMYELHQPRQWIFGHFHRSWQLQEGSTNFTCLGELCSVDLDEQGQVTNTPALRSG